MNRGGFSWARFFGVSREKARLSRRVGFPLWSRQAQYAWFGRLVLRALFGGKK